ncbi:MAG: YceI family protein [Polyangiaceae bacterium]|nr:YceI family protein [Polyangiaceae bacterium]
MNQTIGPQEARFRVYTYKQGLLSALGHDLVLEARKFTIELRDDGTCLATLDPNSLRVVGAVHGDRVESMKPSDCDTIEKAIRNEVLHTSRYPEIVIEGTYEGGTFKGTLSLKGVARPLTLSARETGDSRKIEYSFAPSEHGIPPYKAMLGALKIEDRVRVEVEVPVSTLAA